MARTSRAEWAKRVERWGDSGLSAKEYASQTGLKASTLSCWKWRLGSERRASSGPDQTRVSKRRSSVAAAPRFVEVTPVATPQPEPLTLELPGAITGARARRLRRGHARPRAARAEGRDVIPASTRIFVCSEPQDMRRSFDGLALAAQEHLGQDPQSGALFVFCDKRRDRLKVLWFDISGYCLLYKRLHRARFEVMEHARIDAQTLAMLLQGVKTTRAR